MEKLRKELEQLKIKVQLREAKPEDVDKILCMLGNGYMNEYDYIFIGNFYDREHIKTILNRKFIGNDCFEFLKEESYNDEWMISNAEERLNQYFKAYVEKIKQALF